MPRLKKRTGGGHARAPGGGVRVVVRCRPLLPHEHGVSCDRIFLDNNTITVNDSVGEARQFTFDSVLPPEADQGDSFAEVAPLVDHVLDGFHATVFAYGQTGSGKTYTMEGFRYRSVTSSRLDGSTAKGSAPDPVSTPVEQHGIMLRMIQLLFDRARERQGGRATDHGDNATEGATGGSPSSPLSPTAEQEKDGVEYSFRCSYYQIYNERITDLLRQGTSHRTRHDGARPSLGERGVDEELRVRWHSGDVFKVENLFLYECDTPDKMREALVSGVRQKVMGTHLMNTQSSRSHCVFTVYVERRNAATQQLLSRSELSLVDLAGSEKLKQLASDPSAELVRESIEINASLLALGKVIMALSSRPAGKRAGDGHVPYRDSKLTKLLKHALGGNSVTVMFACITPSDRYVEESVSTLLYAGRAKNIENVPRVNEDPTTVLIRQLREEIEHLKKEVAYYRALATDKVAQQERSVRESVHNATPASSPTGDAVAGGQTDSTSKAGQLADALLAACEMLQKVMAMNGQLRDAFDIVKQDKQAAEQREVQLNAENLALRDRIEMLESIALNPELYVQDGLPGSPADDDGVVSGYGRSTNTARNTASSSDSDDDDDDDEEDAAHSRARSSALQTRSRDRQEDGADAHLTPSPPPRQGAAGASGRRSKPSRVAGVDSAVAPWDTTPLPAPAPSSVSVRHTRGTTETSSPSDVPTDDHAGSQPPPRRVIRAPSPEYDTATEPPASSRRAATSRQATHLSRDTPSPAPPSSEAAASKAKKPKKKKKTKKKMLVQKLKQYEKRYREPSHVETYAEYYDKARASVPENQKHSAAVRDMEEMLKKLPRDMVLSVVPLSLRQAGSFGALAFGGTRDDTRVYEERRQHREDRREELLRKQRALQETLRQDVTQVEEVEREQTLTKGSTTRSVYGAEPVSAPGSGTGKRQHTTKRGDTMPSLPINAAASSSLSSVDRLRAYLDKDKQQRRVE